MADSNQLKIIGVSIFFLLMFFIIKTFLTVYTVSLPHLNNYLLVMSIGLLSAIMGRRYRIDGEPLLVQGLVSTAAIGMAIYFIVEPSTYIVFYPEQQGLATAILYGNFIAFISAIIGFRYPSFLLFAGIQILSARLLGDYISALPMPNHDIKYLAEVSIFIGLFLPVVSRVQWKKYNWSTFDIYELKVTLVFVAIGFHLANYFWSGIAKLALNGPPFEWLFINDVSRLFIVAIEKGVSPIAGFLIFTQYFYDSIVSSGWVFNAFVLFIQIASIIAIFRIKWLKVMAVCFDLLHFGVYLFGGILFWPWIWVNGAILWALRRDTDLTIPFAAKLSCFICILMCGLPFVGGATRLGWYDIQDVRLSVVEAQVNENGPWIPVPLSYFGVHAYSVSYGYFDKAVKKGHYLPSIPGLSYDFDERSSDGNCILPDLKGPFETQEMESKRLGFFDKFMKLHHAAALERTEKYGKYFYYYRLHHHPSNPVLYKDFNKIDINDIVKYRLVTRSICLKLESGILVRNILKEDYHNVQIK
jgi:hypothetical protein